MPVIKTQKRLKQLDVGDELKVIATDPGVMQDIPSMCRLAGHEIISAEEIQHEFHLVIRKGA